MAQIASYPLCLCPRRCSHRALHTGIAAVHKAHTRGVLSLLCRVHLPVRDKRNGSVAHSKDNARRRDRACLKTAANVQRLSSRCAPVLPWRQCMPAPCSAAEGRLRKRRRIKKQREPLTGSRIFICRTFNSRRAGRTGRRLRTYAVSRTSPPRAQNEIELPLVQSRTELVV